MARKQRNKDQRKSPPISTAEYTAREGKRLREEFDRGEYDVLALFALARDGMIEVPGAMPGCQTEDERRKTRAAAKLGPESV